MKFLEIKYELGVSIIDNEYKKIEIHLDMHNKCYQAFC